MKPQRDFRAPRWLYQIRSGKRIHGEADLLLILASRLRSADVPTHLTQDVLVKVPDQTFDHHQRLVRDSSTDGRTKITRKEKMLGCCQNVGIKHVAWILAALNVSRRLWQTIH